MSILDRFRRGGSELVEAKERIEQLGVELAIRSDNMSLFGERLAELELGLEDEGWQMLSGTTDREFSRNGLRIINHLVRLYFLKNPLIRRAVLTQTQYVFGQGVNIRANHPLVDQVVQAFLDDRKNKAELTEHQAHMVKETELQCFANIFFVFFINRFKGHVRVRTIPMDEITMIICNPEDAKDPWYYKREWHTSRLNIVSGEWEDKANVAYYPDWRYKPSSSVDDADGATAIPSQIGGVDVMRDTPIYHVSVNRLSDMQFGVSEVYSALDWARAYKEFLENWASLVKAYARFAWRMTTKGGAAGVSSAKAKLTTTLGTGTETNPPPATGSTFLGTEGLKLDPIRTAGATTSAEDGHDLRLMVSSATGIFEHYLTGDPSTGNLATAKAMELPMLIMFRDRQQLWASIMTEILNFVIDQAVKAAGGPIPGKTEQNDYGEEVVILANDKDNEDEDLRGSPINRTLDISFPNILEKDIGARVDAVVSAATLDGKVPAGTITPKMITRLLLEALGLDDIDEILAEMYPADEEGVEKPPDVEEIFTTAIRKLNQALDEALKQ